jgi:AraC-like DNA-binding protein
MHESIRFHDYPLPGVDAMTASTARAFPRHTHDQYGIGLIDAGAHASWSGRGQVEAGAGSLIAVNPGEVHDGRAIDARPRSWRILYLDPALMDAACADVRDGRGGSASASFAFAAPAFADERVRRRFDAAFAHATAAARDALACETVLLALVASLQRHAAARAAGLPNDGAPTPCIRRARARIDADPAAPVTLAELAAEAGISRWQLLRAFARELGVTPHAYVVQRRVALARRLLRARQARRALAEVALLAGFCDQSHLTRCFVRHVGVTPRRYAARRA